MSKIIFMNLTVKDYAALRNVTPSYVQRMCRDNRMDTLIGVKKFYRLGSQYVLTMQKDYATRIESHKTNRAEHNGKISAARKKQWAAKKNCK